MKRKLIFILLLAVLLSGLFAINRHRAAAPGSVSQSSSSSTDGDRTPQTTFNKSQFSIDDTTSIWLIVNKSRALKPLDYTPTGLVTPDITIRPNAGQDERKMIKAAAEALEEMFAGAKSAGANLMLASGYRSYQTQVAVYNNEVRQYGQAKADTESAQPGHSEHQTGLAADLEDAGRTCEVDDCFVNTIEGKWLAEHAHEYGFVIRYLKGKDTSTGYRYEPWHVRYVGKDLAAELYKNAQTMEEFFNL
jgi:LAS superfamily LD-carboxypeptidase LdcB